MKTTTINKIFKTVSIITLAISIVSIFYMGSQVLQGTHEFFDAADVIYNRDDPAALAQVRNVAGIELLSTSTSIIAMFITGLFGVLFAKNPKRTALCASFAVINIALWALSFVVYDLMLTPVLNAYDIYPNSSLSIIIPIVIVLIIYIVTALQNGKKLRLNNEQVYN